MSNERLTIRQISALDCLAEGVSLCLDAFTFGDTSGVIDANGERITIEAIKCLRSQGTSYTTDTYGLKASKDLVEAVAAEGRRRAERVSTVNDVLAMIGGLGEAQKAVIREALNL